MTRYSHVIFFQCSKK